MLEKDIINILDEILDLLNKVDKCVTFDGLTYLMSAKQQVVIIKTILTIKEQLNENPNDE